MILHVTDSGWKKIGDEYVTLKSTPEDPNEIEVEINMGVDGINNEMVRLVIKIKATEDVDYSGGDAETNSGAVIVYEDDPTPIEPDSPELPEPRLQLTKSVSKVNGNAYTPGDTVNDGDTIEYAITVKNIGEVAINNVKLSDALTGNTGTTAFDAGTLNPSESRTFTATYVVKEANIADGKITKHLRRDTWQRIHSCPLLCKWFLLPRCRCSSEGLQFR